MGAVLCFGWPRGVSSLPRRSSNRCIFPELSARARGCRRFLRLVNTRDGPLYLGGDDPHYLARNAKHTPGFCGTSRSLIRDRSLLGTCATYAGTEFTVSFDTYEENDPLSSFKRLRTALTGRVDANGRGAAGGGGGQRAGGWAYNRGMCCFLYCTASVCCFRYCTIAAGQRRL